MAKHTNRGRSSELSARSPCRRERRVRDCAVAARPGIRPALTIPAPATAPGGPVSLTWNLIQATDWHLTQTTDWNLRQTTGRNPRQAKELTPS